MLAWRNVSRGGVWRQRKERLTKRAQNVFQDDGSRQKQQLNENVEEHKKGGGR